MEPEKTTVTRLPEAGRRGRTGLAATIALLARFRAGCPAPTGGGSGADDTSGTPSPDTVAPAPVTGVTATPAGVGAIRPHRTSPTDNDLAAFEVPWSPAGSTGSQVTLGRSAAGVTLTDLRSNTHHEITVVAINTSGNRSEGSGSSATTPFRFSTGTAYCTNVDNLRATYAVDLEGNRELDLLHGAGGNASIVWYENLTVD